MINKRLRMVLDFEVEVEELTEEGLHLHYRQYNNYEELVADTGWWENARRQIRLQRVLLEDEEALRKYFTYVAAVEVDDSNDSRICEVFGVGGERAEEDILETLLPRLSEEDEKFYREAADVLFENVEALSRSFKGRMTGARMEEVCTMVEGRLEGGESDNLM
jgi:DNA-binding Lrp family transcriptional regulator